MLKMLRSLKDTKSQFLSIVFVIAIGSLMFAGMFAAYAAISSSVDYYFETQNMADLWCYFKGITQDEIDQLFSSEEVQTAEGRHAFLTQASINGVESQLIIRSMTEINQSLLSGGRFPENPYEIIIDNGYAAANNLSVGDSLSVNTNTGTIDLMVIGLCYNPEVIVKGNENTNFSHNMLGVAYGTNETLINLIRTTPDYLEMRADIDDRRREGQIELDEANQQLANAQQDIDSFEQAANEELRSAEQLLSDANRDIQEGLYELSTINETTQEQMNTYQLQLDEARRSLQEMIEQVNTQFAEGEQALDQARRSLDNQLADFREELENMIVYVFYVEGHVGDSLSELYEFEETEMSETEMKYMQTLLEWNNFQADIMSGHYDIDLIPDEQLDDLGTAMSQIIEGFVALNIQQQELERRRAEADAKIEQAQMEIDNRQQEFNSRVQDGLVSIAYMQSSLFDAQQTYAQGLQDYEEQRADVESQISEAQDNIEEQSQILREEQDNFVTTVENAEAQLEDAVQIFQEVLVLTYQPDIVKALAQSNDNFVAAVERSNTMSYLAVDASIHPLRSLAVVFPMIFFLVAAFISFISVTKMVESQRTQISVMCAIGVPKWKLQVYFLMYVLIASIVGTFLFAILGNIVLPRILIGIFVADLDIPQIYAPIYISNVLIAFPLVFLFTGVAVFLATRKTLSLNPAQGMQPAAPKHSKPILVEHITPIWKRLDTVSKMAIRSIFRNKIQIVLSSTGVIGTVALLITGFSLEAIARDSIRKTERDIQHDLIIDFQGSQLDEYSLNISEYIVTTEWSTTQIATVLLEEEFSIHMQFLESGTQMNNFYDVDGNNIPFESDSFIIPHTMARDYNLKIGDSLNLDIGGYEYAFVITGINEQIFQKRLFVSMCEGKNAGLDINATTMLAKLYDSDLAEPLAEKLQTMDEAPGVMTRQSQIEFILEVTRMLNVLITVIIFASVVLSIAVVYNLACINMQERTKDYSVVLAMGYTSKDVNNMIRLESTFITIVGSILGTPLGYFIYQYFRDAVTRDNLTPSQHLSIFPALGAIVIAFALSALINYMLRGKISEISLIDSLKA